MFLEVKGLGFRKRQFICLNNTLLIKLVSENTLVSGLKGEIPTLIYMIRNIVCNDIDIVNIVKI